MVRKFEKDSEATLDYILPDYLGDIKRVLSVSARAQNDALYVGEDGVEASGSVYFDVLYTDALGNLSEFSSSADFDSAFSIPSGSYRSGIVRNKIIQSTHRVTSPRKMTIKAKVLTSLHSDFALPENEELVGAECEKETVPVFCADFFEKRENEYKCELSVDEELFGEYEIISSFGEVKIEETVIANGMITVRGEYVIGAIIKDEGGAVHVVKTTVPFEEMVSAENEPENAGVSAYVDVTSINVTEDEDKSKLTVLFTSDMFIDSSKNENIELVRDAYFKGYISDTEYKTFEKSRLVGAKCVLKDIELSLDETVQDTASLREILLPRFSVQSQSTSVSKSGVDVTGDIAFSGVACEINEAGELGYAPIKAVLPYSFSVPIDTDGADAAECIISPFDSDAVIEKGGVRLSVKANVFLKTFENESVSVISKINKDAERPPRNKSTYTVYFPLENDTLFSVAKRFDTSKDDIARDNSISAEASTSQDRVLPKRLLIT